MFLVLEGGPDTAASNLDVGAALPFVPGLNRLELFFPSVFDEDDMALFTRSICSERWPAITRAWDAFQIDDEAEFWGEVRSRATGGN